MTIELTNDTFLSLDAPDGEIYEGFRNFEIPEDLLQGEITDVDIEVDFIKRAGGTGNLPQCEGIGLALSAPEWQRESAVKLIDTSSFDTFFSDGWEHRDAPSVITFDQEASTTVDGGPACNTFFQTPPCCPPSEGSYRPTGGGSLADFNGLDPRGIWTLFVADEGKDILDPGDSLGTPMEFNSATLRITVDLDTEVGGSNGQGSSIVSWGRDEYGQVSDTPTGTGFTAIAGGGYHSLALKADGSIVSWGYDQQDVVSNTPTDSGFIAIVGTFTDSLALAADGSIVSWGRDFALQVADTPTGSGFIAIAGGFSDSLALAADGSIVSWGRYFGQEVSDTPTGSGFIAIAGGAVGGSSSLALAADGSIVSWGSDAYGQVSNTPTETGFIAIAGGGSHRLALKADGSIVSWGRDAYGQVSNTPTETGFTAIAGGYNHSVALAADGSIVSWGRDEYGQVSNTPTGTGFTAIAGGGVHSLALVPEPTTALLQLTALLTLLTMRRRNR